MRKFTESQDNGLTKEDAEQLFGEIDNQGFDYWLSNYSGAYFKSADGTDEELEKLCKEACEAIDKADAAIRKLWKKHGIH